MIIKVVNFTFITLLEGNLNNNLSLQETLQATKTFLPCTKCTKVVCVKIVVWRYYKFKHSNNFRKGVSNIRSFQGFFHVLVQNRLERCNKGHSFPSWPWVLCLSFFLLHIWHLIAISIMFMKVVKSKSLTPFDGNIQETKSISKQQR